MIAVVATLAVKDGQQAEFEAGMKELVEKVNANEPGCKLYTLSRAKDGSTYVVMERYVDKDAFKAHSGTDYFKEVFGRIGGTLAGAPKIDILEELAGG